jgi:hypothetical protein
MLDLLAGFTYIISLFLVFFVAVLWQISQKRKKEIGISLTHMDERARSVMKTQWGKPIE